jgi:hypothetical protein
MLTRLDVDAFGTRTGSDVRLLAKSRDNGGVETAFFTYAGDDLDPLEIDGHPACELTVLAGRRVFRVTAVEGAAGGVYDLFEALPDGTEVDLEEEIDLAFGPIHQVFLVGRSTAGRAARARTRAPRTPAGKTAEKPRRKKPVRKKPGRKKPVRKQPAPRKPGPKKPPRKKRAAKKVTRPSARKAASRRTSPRRRR